MKTTPAQIEAFVLHTTTAVPGSTVTIDAPRNPDGEWFIDVSAGDFQTAVAWRSAHGFGFFTAPSGYGDRPNEVFKSDVMAGMRLKQLHDQWIASSSVRPVSLAQLRQLTGTPQATLATALHLNQPAVSRFEKREDVKISTLTSYLEAMGGRLDIRAHFEELGFSVDLHAYSADS